GVGEAVHRGVHVDRVGERVAGAGRDDEGLVDDVGAAVGDLHVLEVDAQHRVGDVEQTGRRRRRAVVGPRDVVVHLVADLRHGVACLILRAGRLAQVVPYTTLFRSGVGEAVHRGVHVDRVDERVAGAGRDDEGLVDDVGAAVGDLHVLEV